MKLPVLSKSPQSLVTLAALAAISGGACAQSSVTVFGVVDATVRYVKNNDQKLWSLASGGQVPSRLGFRGIEDLGDGLKAGFWLETGYSVDSGTQADASRYWSRRSTVSLLGNFGELRLGRDFTPSYLGYTDFDPFFDSGVAFSSKFDSSLGTARDTGTRSDNQVIYLTPGTLGGFYARLAVAPGEATPGKKYYGGRIGYAAGPVDVTVSYAQTTVAPVGGEDTFKVADVAASYDLGAVKLLGYYTQNKFASQKIARASVSAVAPFGMSQIKATYIHADASGTNAAGVNVDANDADQVALGYVYNLSKRTSVYGTAAYIKNKGNATFAVASTPALVAGGKKSTGLDIGLRHNF